MSSWLDETELEAWRGLLLMHLQLTATLSRELAGATGLSYQDYLVLAALTDRPDGRMRAFELGRELGWEKSRLSHHISRMVERSLVRRERCPTDQRGAFVVVSAQGRKAIEAAAPGHVAGVREHFVDHVSRSELKTLAAVAQRVRAALADDDR
jgi:DNA-binding MarR family transcriptional regulator